MSFYTQDYESFRGCGCEYSQPMALDPRWLDSRTTPVNIIPATQPAEDTSPNKSQGPAHSPVPAMSADSDRDTAYGLLPLQLHIDPALYAADSCGPPCTDGGAVDSHLCSSPVSLSRPLSLGNALPTANPEYQNQTSSSSSGYSSAIYQASCSDISTADVDRESPKPTTFYAQAPAINVTVVHQRWYQERRPSKMLSSMPRQFIDFGPHGYPVSSVSKGKKLVGLPNASERAFRDVDVGQKLSWRFLFDGLPESARQFNVLDGKRTQPTVERIVRETVKALKCFQEEEPRFTYPLHRLVILKIELVSSASVQATIGVLRAEDVTTGAQPGYISQNW